MYRIYSDDYQESAHPATDSDGAIELIWDHPDYPRTWCARHAPFGVQGFSQLEWGVWRAFAYDSVFSEWMPFYVLLRHFGLLSFHKQFDPEGKMADGLIHLSPAGLRNLDKLLVLLVATYYERRGLRIGSVRKLHFDDLIHIAGTFAGEPITIPYLRPADGALIDLAASTAENESSERSRRIFLCHASEDKEFARNLASKLRYEGVHVWFDEWELKPGDSIVSKINQGIENCDYMAVVLSQHSVTKKWCQQEMDTGLHLQLSNKGVTVVPIKIEECSVPPLFASLLWADFEESFDKGLTQILRLFKDS